MRRIFPASCAGAARSINEVLQPLHPAVSVNYDGSVAAATSDYCWSPEAHERVSRRQFTEQCLGLFQIERVKLFGKPAVDRSQKIASLIALSLIAPQRCKARGGAHAKLRLYAPVASDKHFLSEARLRCTVKLLSSGLIVAALLRETGQRRPVEVLAIRLDLAGVLGANAGYDAK
jgi:hypothetical protein